MPVITANGLIANEWATFSVKQPGGSADAVAPTPGPLDFVASGGVVAGGYSAVLAKLSFDVTGGAVLGGSAIVQLGIVRNYYCIFDTLAVDPNITGEIFVDSPITGSVNV